MEDGENQGIVRRYAKKKLPQVWKAVRKACQRAVEKNGKEKGGRAAYKNITPVKGWRRIKQEERKEKCGKNVEISFPQAVEKTVEKTKNSGKRRKRKFKSGKKSVCFAEVHKTATAAERKNLGKTGEKIKIRRNSFIREQKQKGGDKKRNFQ